MSVEDLRISIDDLDESIIQILNERTQLAIKIGELKQQGQRSIYVPSREKAVMERIASLNKGPLSNASLQAIYREIMSASLALEHDVKMAYMGSPLTRHHQSAMSRFGASIKYLPHANLPDLLQSLLQDQSDYALVPLEEVLHRDHIELLEKPTHSNVNICAEFALSQSLHLVGIPGSRERWKTLFSEPLLFHLCRNWLKEHMPDMEQVVVANQDMAAQRAADSPLCGALTDRRTAEGHGLEFVASNIQDTPGQEERFLVFGKGHDGPSGHDKTMVLFTFKQPEVDRVGALRLILKHHVSLIAIKTFPDPQGGPSQKVLVELEGHAEEGAVSSLLEEVKSSGMNAHLLGSYPLILEPIYR